MLSLSSSFANLDDAGEDEEEVSFRGAGLGLFTWAALLRHKHGTVAWETEACRQSPTQRMRGWYPSRHPPAWSPSMMTWCPRAWYQVRLVVWQAATVDMSNLCMAVGQHQWYHFILFWWGLGCSLGVRGFDPCPYTMIVPPFPRCARWMP